MLNEEGVIGERQGYFDLMGELFLLEFTVACSKGPLKRVVSTGKCRVFTCTAMLPILSYPVVSTGKCRVFTWANFELVFKSKGHRFKSLSVFWIKVI